ncbi:MAG TPA: prepilin-type N-terminal cleavage/methylation domain-containing protein [Roseimicrobium sp.]|nr:prepilin-type N-terminal cleavage/methylation domain-containing protein [Roseimicrobium sp.]
MHPSYSVYSSKGVSKHLRGMTLVEIMTVLGIMMLVVGGLLAFSIQSLNIYHYDSGKLLVNRDMRQFTAEMTDNATYANYFIIYPSFTQRSVTANSITTDWKRYAGESGNMLVLVFLDTTDSTKISRIVGYYRDPNENNGEAPVRKFDRTLSPSVTADVWTLLPATSTAQTNPEVIELSKNLGSQELFYNFYGRSVLVKCEIIHRTGTGKNHYERATNTYNFTVSPRG